MRCFVALDLPRPVCNYLAGLAGQLAGKGDVKWVPAHQLHLTLAFGAEVDEAAVAGLREAVQTAPLGPMQLALAGLGHFPARGEPRVLWAALGGDLAALGALYEHVAARAEALGIEREKRGFVPHVTIGRVKSPFGALALIDAVKKLSGELRDKPFAPTALALYGSELRPGGPIHTPLLVRPLATAGDPVD